MNRIRKFERALKEGSWYEQTKSTRYFGDIAIGVGLVVAAGASVYATTTQAGIANQQLGLEATQAQKQNQSFMQLQQLINDPSSFFDSPVYKSAAAQGSSAVARQNAAAFGPNSGNEATALQAYGQSFGAQQLLSQEELLAGMSGTGFNPSAAGSVASGAASSAAGGLNSLAGLLSFFGTSGMGGGAGGASTAVTYDPSAGLADWNAANTPEAQAP